MRIAIVASALAHGITTDEIRTVINNYDLRVSVVSNLYDDADDYFYVGRAAVNQPHIEVIADHIDPNEAVVFHAMMLRPSNVKNMGLDLFITPEYSRQRG